MMVNKYSYEDNKKTIQNKGYYDYFKDNGGNYDFNEIDSLLKSCSNLNYTERPSFEEILN